MRKQKPSILSARITSSLMTAGFLFGLHYGAGWSWQVSLGLAWLSQIADYIAIISRQIQGYYRDGRA